MIDSLEVVIQQILAASLYHHHPITQGWVCRFSNFLSWLFSSRFITAMASNLRFLPEMNAWCRALTWDERMKRNNHWLYWQDTGGDFLSSTQQIWNWSANVSPFHHFISWLFMCFICPFDIQFFDTVFYLLTKFLKLSKCFRSRALTPFSRKKLMRILGFANFLHVGPDGRERQSSFRGAEKKTGCAEWRGGHQGFIINHRKMNTIPVKILRWSVNPLWTLSCPVLTCLKKSGTSSVIPLPVYLSGSHPNQMHPMVISWQLWTLPLFVLLIHLISRKIARKVSVRHWASWSSEKGHKTLEELPAHGISNDTWSKSRGKTRPKRQKNSSWQPTTL